MMQSQKQEKICLGCEGTISVSALYCPYCGSDVKAQEEFLQDEAARQSNSAQSLQEMSNLSSLYKPPYIPNQRGFGVPSYQEHSQESQDFSYGNSFDSSISPSIEQPKSFQKEAQKTEVGLWPLLFLSIGMNLLTIGLLLFFFSDRGKLILEWNSYYWFVYCILATPLLMFGWRLLQSSEEVE